MDCRPAKYVVVASGTEPMRTLSLKTHHCEVACSLCTQVSILLNYLSHVGSRSFVLFYLLLKIRLLVTLEQWLCMVLRDHTSGFPTLFASFGVPSSRALLSRVEDLHNALLPASQCAHRAKQ